MSSCYSFKITFLRSFHFASIWDQMNVLLVRCLQSFLLIKSNLLQQKKCLPINFILWSENWGSRLLSVKGIDKLIDEGSKCVGENNDFESYFDLALTLNDRTELSNLKTSSRLFMFSIPNKSQIRLFMDQVIEARSKKVVDRVSCKCRLLHNVNPKTCFIDQSNHIIKYT